MRTKTTKQRNNYLRTERKKTHFCDRRIREKFSVGFPFLRIRTYNVWDKMFTRFMSRCENSAATVYRMEEHLPPCRRPEQCIYTAQAQPNKMLILNKFGLARPQQCESWHLFAISLDYSIFVLEDEWDRLAMDVSTTITTLSIIVPS